MLLQPDGDLQIAHNELVTVTVTRSTPTTWRSSAI